MFEDMVDIHSHALWGMDDGARYFEETMDLCFMAEESGTKTLFLTPHLIYWNQAETLYDLREEKVEELAGMLEVNGADIEVKKGFEILCDDDIFNVKYFKPYTLNESRYILIEFDFFKSNENDVTSWCNYLSSFGLVPIIAHPERYRFVLDDAACIERLSQNGVLFQINAGSPAGMFGRREAEISCGMLNSGYVDFIGSDAHDLFSRNTDIYDCMEMYPEFIDEVLLKKAAVFNPKVILNDEPYSPERFDYISNI